MAQYNSKHKILCIIFICCCCFIAINYNYWGGSCAFEFVFVLFRVVSLCTMKFIDWPDRRPCWFSSPQITKFDVELDNKGLSNTSSSNWFPSQLEPLALDMSVLFNRSDSLNRNLNGSGANGRVEFVSQTVRVSARERKREFSNYFPCQAHAYIV